MPGASEALLERSAIALGPGVIYDAGGSAVVIAHGNDDHIRAQRLTELLRGFVVRFANVDGASEREAGIDDGFSSVIRRGDIDSADHETGHGASVVMPGLAM